MDRYGKREVQAEGASWFASFLQTLFVVLAFFAAAACAAAAELVFYVGDSPHRFKPLAGFGVLCALYVGVALVRRSRRRCAEEDWKGRVRGGASALAQQTLSAVERKPEGPRPGPRYRRPDGRPAQVGREGGDSRTTPGARGPSVSRDAGTPAAVEAPRERSQQRPAAAGPHPDVSEGPKGVDADAGPGAGAEPQREAEFEVRLDRRQLDELRRAIEDAFPELAAGSGPEQEGNDRKRG